MSGVDDIYTKRPIGHAEAREIAARLINSHFRKEPHARASIPARPDYDDDLLICAYIRQQRVLVDAPIPWRPMPTAPRDGRWIIALAADRASVFRIGWGREDGSYPSWSSFNSTYGEAFFIGWIPCPQDAPGEVADDLDPDLNCDPDPSSADALSSQEAEPR